MAFYAKYPATTVAVSGTSTVQGPGTAGAQSGGVLTVQGDPAGTPIPISGSISATNPSVGLTNSSPPGQATFIGAFDTGTGLFIGLTATDDDLNVSVKSSVLPTGAATEATLGSIDTNTAGLADTGYGDASGSSRVAAMIGFDSDGVTDLNPLPIYNAGAAFVVSGTVDSHIFDGNGILIGSNFGGSSGGLRVAAQPGNATGAADFNYGAGGAQTLRTTAMLGLGSTVVSSSNPVPTTNAAAAVTWQTEGSIAFGAMTTSFATALTVAATLVWVGLRNNTNAIIVVSLDSGTTSSFTLDPGDQVSLDLKCQNKSIAAAVTIQAKYTGSAPTSGTFRVNGYS